MTTVDLWVGPPAEPDRYQLGQLSGSGSEGLLYRGSLTTESGVALDVAIKMLHPRFANQVTAIGRRWAEQLELLRSLRVAGMVAVRDVFTGALPHAAGEAGAGGAETLYLVMNWVEGIAVDQWATEHRSTGAAELLKLLLPVAAALDLAHSGVATGGIPVVHCDIKPANILVTAAGEAVLVDPGLTRVLPGGGHGSAITGTPGYLAPEVLADGAYSAASDGYALAMVVWSLLTGADPPEECGPQRLHGELARAYPDQPALVAHVLAMLDPIPGLRPVPLANWCAQVRDSSLLPDDAAAQLPPLAPVAAGGGSRRLRPRSRFAALAAALALVALGVVALVGLATSGTTRRVVAAPSGVLAPPTTSSAPSSSPAPTSAAPTTSLAPNNAGSAAVAGNAAAVTCTNEALGYHLTVPSGWRTNPASRSFNACQVFDDRPFDAATLASDPLGAPIQFGSLAGPPSALGYGIDETGRSNLRIAGAPAVLVTATATKYDPVPAGTQIAAYVVDEGRHSLVAQLLTPSSAASSVRRSQRQALDALVGSLQLTAPTCHNSTDGRCGEFYFSMDPAPNQPIAGQVVVSPPEPRVGQPVMFTVTVTDPDADTFTGIGTCFGDGACAAGSAATFCSEIFCRLGPARPRQPSGSWTPPPVKPGSMTFTFSHTYAAVGTYRAQFSVRSANSAALPDHDPYASYNPNIETVVVVQ